ncbi:unnamed protein product [Lymnaea stagnalis]|uniref:Ribosomal L1 domain-containing protein 1 n=1 Tax=Lymnaea stagnalis TaxID=6523 RepID=A0AAV2HJB6_LYMST
MASIQLNKAKISKAVEVLQEVVKSAEKKDSLLEELDIFQMQVCLKKIPHKEKSIKLILPHALQRPDLDVCLFVKDLNREERDYESTVRHFQDLLKKNGVNAVTDIIPLKSLKTEYKPYEAKRNLSNAYDIFLADARIIRLLPTYLGKHFYGKKKTPVQVNLQIKNLSKEIDEAIGSSRCIISSKGASSTTVVGQLQMAPADITENIIAAVDQIAAAVGGGASNIKQLNLKSRTSMSVPIYISDGGPQDIAIPKEKSNKGDVEAEEISTLFGAKVKVYPNGKIMVIRDGEEQKKESVKRKRISKERGNKKRKTVTSTYKPKGTKKPKSRKMLKSS